MMFTTDCWLVKTCRLASRVRHIFWVLVTHSTCWRKIWCIFWDFILYKNLYGNWWKYWSVPVEKACFGRIVCSRRQIARTVYSKLLCTSSFSFRLPHPPPSPVRDIQTVKGDDKTTVNTTFFTCSAPMDPIFSMSLTFFFHDHGSSVTG